MEGKEKLRLGANAGKLGVAAEFWQAALQKAVPDKIVGIRHAPVSGDENYRIHVAAIPQKVGCHFHSDGDEQYAVVAGSGTLHWGKAIPVTAADGSATGYRVAWEKAVDVAKGDNFTIPEGYAHQLAKRGSEDLVILFGCPDSHLNDAQDRTLLPDAPALAAAPSKKRSAPRR